MKTQDIRGRLLASSTICGAAFLALSTTHAVAAEAAAAEVSEIVVTGSRIPQPNLSSVSPIQVVTDQEIKLQGKTDVIDLINAEHSYEVPCIVTWKIDDGNGEFLEWIEKQTL